MKRIDDHQQGKISANILPNRSVNLQSSENNLVSNNGPTVVPHASGITYQSHASPLVKTNYSVSESCTSNTVSNQPRHIVQATNNFCNIRPQTYPELSPVGSKLPSPEVVPHSSAEVSCMSETMQSSVQSYPHQMQTSYQLSTTVPVSSHDDPSTSVPGGGPAPNQQQSATPQPLQSHQVLQTTHHTSTTPQVPAAQQQFQRLKVEDALSYLDKVKFKFGSQPQVYNDFLDIMKEFKSQSIDTPGVINRVSNLFKGHPELIVGFNTFLPPGYKIEVHSNEQVNVSMPGSGTPTIIHPGNPALTPQNSSQFFAAVDAAMERRNLGAHGSLSTTNERNQSSATVSGNGPQQTNQNSGLLSPTTGSNHTSPLHTPSNLQSASQQSQPVEFNHAINYVNKIKNRFHGHPDIYKQFLEILHTYQKEQRNLKEGLPPSLKPLTESEVYAQVAKLFQNQEDLLREFGQFLPDANGSGVTPAVPSKAITNDHSTSVKKMSFNKNNSSTSNTQNHHQTSRPNQLVKRPSSMSQFPTKKLRLGSYKDFSLAEAGKFGSLNDFAYFDKIRKAVKHQENYDNFLRCIYLFNQEIVSRSELVHLILPFLSKHPDLLKRFKDFIGFKECGTPTIEPIPNRISSQERMRGDWETEVDYASCKQHGTSYRALPKSYVQPKCSGRSSLCREVLNDTYVSFPTWSEDSTFVSSRKTQFEEYIYRCEDERFELDVVIESNLSTIRVLEGIQKKIVRMSPEESSKFRLDDSLGGTSQVIHQRSIRRIYGERAQDIIDGLKRNPVVGIPLVLKRLKAKEEEWREAQKGFNKIWREQNEKYYLKSLDHQGINFKQNDIRNLRSKSLLNEIESKYMEDGPHLTIGYRDKLILDDACNLIIHHVKRQTAMQKNDKQKIKVIMKQFIPDLFFSQRQELSDDEIDKDDEIDCDDGSSNDGNKVSSCSVNTRSSVYNSSSLDSCNNKHKNNSTKEKFLKSEAINGDIINGISKNQSNMSSRQISPPEEAYNLFFGSSAWYLFFRLHNILCDRLTVMYLHAVRLTEEEARDKTQRKDATSIALKLQPKQEYEVEEYYSALLEMIKSVLDGNLDNTQYEDSLRDMFGIHAYIAFSFDKVLINIVRQLQHIVCDGLNFQFIDTYHQEKRNGGAGGLCATALQRTANEVSYQKKVEQKFCDESENIFKFHIYKVEGKVSIEMLDTVSDGTEDLGEMERWSAYVEKYVGSESISEELQHLPRKPVFIARNIRMWKKRVNRLSLKRIKDKNLSSSGNEDTKNNDSSDETSDKNDCDYMDMINDDMEIIDNTQCKFTLNSFKLVYVTNSQSYMYKFGSLKRAVWTHEKVSKRLNSKFKQWHQKWCDEHISETQSKNTNDWLLGLSAGLVRNVTRCVTNNDLSKSPYTQYNRYKVEMTNS